MSGNIYIYKIYSTSLCCVYSEYLPTFGCFFFLLGINPQPEAKGTLPETKRAKAPENRPTVNAPRERSRKYSNHPLFRGKLAVSFREDRFGYLFSENDHISPFKAGKK